MLVGSRPSVIRVLIGGLILGPVGAIARYAARKKTYATVRGEPSAKKRNYPKSRMYPKDHVVWRPPDEDTWVPYAKRKHGRPE